MYGYRYLVDEGVLDLVQELHFTYHHLYTARVEASGLYLSCHIDGAALHHVACPCGPVLSEQGYLALPRIVFDGDYSVGGTTFAHSRLYVGDDAA